METTQQASTPTISNKPKSTILMDILKYIVVILLIVLLGVFVMNQVIEYRYKAIFLLTPCELCTKLNPQFKDCFSFKYEYGNQPYAYNETQMHNLFNITLPS